MGHLIAPDTTKRAGPDPTHYHCYRWSGSGQEWDKIGRTDSLDRHSPDRPPVRTSEWLNKSPRFIIETHTEAKAARDWLIAEWKQACAKAMTPVPDWVLNSDRPARALHAIETRCWPSYSQWLAGGSIVVMSVVGTAERCH